MLILKIVLKIIKKEIIMKHIIAIDCSDSTYYSENAQYWSTVKDYLIKLSKENSDVSCILWDSKIQEEVSITQLIKHLQNQPNFKYKKNGGGTYPSCFIKKLPFDESGIALTIFTDGQVGEWEVKNCEDLLNAKKIKFKELNVFYIGSIKEMNHSVTAAFSREERIPLNGKIAYTVTINDGPSKEINLEDPVKEIEKYFDKPKLFFKEAKSLVDKLDLQNLGRTNENTKIKNKLVELKINLLTHIIKKKEEKTEGKTEGKYEEILKNLKKGQETEAFTALNNLFNCNNQNSENGLDSKSENKVDSDEAKLDSAFHKLFVALDRKDGYNFNRKITNTHCMATTTTQVAINNLATEVKEINEETVDYICPITLNEDVPILPVRNVLQKTKTPNPFTSYTLKDLLGPKFNAAFDDCIIRDLILKRFKQENFPLKEEISKDKLLKLFEKDKHAKRLVASKDSAIDEFVQRFKYFYLNNSIAFLGDNALVELIKKRLDDILGLNTINSILEHSDENKDKNNFISPTQQLISSFISASNEASHIQSTHYATVDLFFGKKTCYGERSLWLAVLYKIIKDQDRFDRGFVLALKERLIDQLCTDETNITLSNLPEHGPILKVPVALALWYCVRSPQFIKDFRHNRLRSIGTKYHLELLDELNFPYNKAETLHLLARYKLFAWMMNLAKESPKKLDNWLRSFYQNSINCDGTLVFLDGPANYDLKTLEIGIFENNGYDTKSSPIICINNEDKDKAAENSHFIDTLSLSEVYTLYKLVDPKEKTENIDIDSRIDSLLEDQSLINSQLSKPETHYNLEYSRIKSIEDDPTQVCPFTLRPYKDSTKNAITLFGSKNKQLFAYKYFSNFVKQFKKFPTTYELLIYMAEKQSQKEDSKNTLPDIPAFTEISTSIINKHKSALNQFLLNIDRVQSILMEFSGCEPSQKANLQNILNVFKGDIPKQLETEFSKKKEVTAITETKELKAGILSKTNNKAKICRPKTKILTEVNEFLEQKIKFRPIEIQDTDNRDLPKKFGKFEIEILDEIMKFLNQKKLTILPEDFQALLTIIETKPNSYQKCDKYKIETLNRMMDFFKQNEVNLQLEDIHTIQAILQTKTTGRRDFYQFKKTFLNNVEEFLKQKGFQLKCIQPHKKNKTTTSKKFVLTELTHENRKIWLFNNITTFFSGGKNIKLQEQLEKAYEEIPKNQSTSEEELLSMQNTYRNVS